MLYQHWKEMTNNFVDWVAGFKNEAAQKDETRHYLSLLMVALFCGYLPTGLALVA